LNNVLHNGSRLFSWPDLGTLEYRATAQPPTCQAVAKKRLDEKLGCSALKHAGDGTGPLGTFRIPSVSKGLILIKIIIFETEVPKRR